jgi:hypothetical protein
MRVMGMIGCEADGREVVAMEGAPGILEYNPLDVAFAISLRLEAFVAGWPCFVAFNPALSACYIQMSLVSQEPISVVR